MKKTLIHHSRLRDQFTIVPNTIARSNTLSLRAKGMLLAILSNCPEWQVTNRYLRTICKDGAKAVTSTLQELEAEGYAVCEVLRGRSGKIRGQDWHFYDAPVPEDQRSTPKIRGGKSRVSTSGTNRITPSRHAVEGGPQKTIEQKTMSQESEGHCKQCTCGHEQTLKASEEQKKKDIPRPPKKMAGIRVPKKHELLDYMSERNLHNVFHKRPLLYHEWKADNWNIWKPKKQRWEPIRDWEALVLSLERKMAAEERRRHSGGRRGAAYEYLETREL